LGYQPRGLESTGYATERQGVKVIEYRLRDGPPNGHGVVDQGSTIQPLGSNPSEKSQQIKALEKLPLGILMKPAEAGPAQESLIKCSATSPNFRDLVMKSLSTPYLR